MKPENKEHHEDLLQIKHHLESIAKLMDKFLSKNKITQDRYDIFKEMNNESIQAVQGDIAELEKN